MDSLRTIQDNNKQTVGSHVAVDCNALLKAGNTTNAGEAPCTCEADQFDDSYHMPETITFTLWNNCVGAEAGSMIINIKGRFEINPADSCSILSGLFNMAVGLGGGPLAAGGANIVGSLFCDKVKQSGTFIIS
ncbi:hypothetical protein HK105_202041 [Polyrhizophydium stewartii]|uniref:Uncharacterized protein n=1 Tax=Polyrhizophydium stewartii TaxID=2732419 RepID=A0ABR4NGI1_9FUNG|nr:hypothetical protein HK105_004458 [Polyrhizophydium stewartii]